MKSLVKKILLHILLPLVLGLLIYIETRTGSIKLFYGPEIKFHHPVFHNLHETSWIKRFIIYSGPDFFWSYSFTSALFIWRSYSGRVSFSFFIAVVVIMALSELIQLSYPINFTFDIADLVAAILATGLSYFLNTRNV